MGEDQPATIGELIEELRALGAYLPDGPDTPVQLGICDGQNLQMIEHVDVTYWEHRHTSSPTPSAYFALIRGHHHPGERAGELLRGAASDVDNELRELRELDSDDEA